MLAMSSRWVRTPSLSPGRQAENTGVLDLISSLGLSTPLSPLLPWNLVYFAGSSSSQSARVGDLRDQSLVLLL